MPYDDVRRAVQWLSDVLGLRAAAVYDGPDGSIVFAELVWRTGVVFVHARAAGDNPWAVVGPASIALSAPDAGTVDRQYERAVAAGAEIVRPIHDARTPAFPGGSHQFDVRDPEGNLWTLGTYQPRHTQPDPTTDVIRRWIAFANEGFAGEFDEFIAVDYIGHVGGNEMDRAELERVERDFHRAFPDTRYSIEDLVAERDRVALRVTTRATHRGEFQGIAPTGRSVEFTALVIYRIHGGKIAESWGEVDFIRLMRQLRAGATNS